MVEQLRGYHQPIYSIDDAGWYAQPKVWRMSFQEFTCALKVHGDWESLQKVAEQEGIMFEIYDAAWPQETKVQYIHHPLRFYSFDKILLPEPLPASFPRDIPIFTGEVYPLKLSEELMKWGAEVAMKEPELFEDLPEQDRPTQRARRRHGDKAKATGKGPRKEWWNR